MKSYLTFGIVLASISFAGCASSPLNSTDTDQLNVVATFYPLGYLAEQVAGEHAMVTTIVPAAVEPHDYSPTPRDISKATASDVFIYNGGGLDTWAEQIAAEDFQQPAAYQIKAASVATTEDPHVWLDPVLMQELVNTIRNVYSDVDPEHTTNYEQNAEALIAKLQTLDQAYQTGLAQCQIRQAIVTHDAFAYVADRYDIELLPIVGLNPNETPSAQTIANLSTTAREHDIRYIFFEELTSPKLSEVLAAEVGADTLVLSPLEGLSIEEQSAGEDYFSMMEQNLENLQLALRCQ